MTCREAKNFYSQDAKEYQLNSNEDFLIWLKISIALGYNCFINIDSLQTLINDVTLWYEIKYPVREFDKAIGEVGFDFKNIKKLSDIMDMKQLLYRLSHDQLWLMQCGYRADHFSIHTIYKDGKPVGEEWKTFVDITKKQSNFNRFLLSADFFTGEVTKDANVKKYLGGMESVNLDELLDILKEYPEEIDIMPLEKCVNCHNTDIELRHRILQLIALKLLYSCNATPEIGYERAKRFISEFNQYFGLTLSTNEIDEIMNRDYKTGKKKFQKKKIFKQ